MKTALIGHPVAQSLSPVIHQSWMHRYGIVGQYDLIDCPPEHLSDTVKTLIQKNYIGFNITIPHKDALLKLCHQLDDHARMIGAVNTVKINPDGTLFGSNTDAYGFIESIRHTYPDVIFKGKSAFIIGAGGAAKAVIYGLLSQGCTHFILTNRTLARATELIDWFNPLFPEVFFESVAWGHIPNIEVDFIVNSSALGMIGQNPLPIELSNIRLKKDGLVCDIVYKPLMTQLLLQAQQKGDHFVTGIGMLAFQAQGGFHLWHGHYPKIDKDFLDDLIGHTL